MKNSYSWLKQLIIGILGTSIGVGLTFMGDRIVENHKQRVAQHETAVMAVCDIDEIVQGLKDEIQLEDSLFKLMMYVATHQELIDSLSIDTLDMAFKYLYDDPTVVKEWTSDMKENAFNSGIDARMNLGNNQFYDNVQQCYYVRRSLMKVMADAPMFRRPLSKDAYEDFMYELPPAAFAYDGVPFPGARRQIMKQVFAYKSTTLYIKRYFNRKDAYQNAVSKLERLNRENKLLMDITEEDIEKYLKQNSENVSQEDMADLIIGKWVVNKDTIVVHEDNTIEWTLVRENQFQILLDDEQGEKEVFVVIPTAVLTKGQWTLHDDTLISDYDCSSAEMLSFDFDTSNFPQSSLELLKDSLEIKKEEVKNYILEQYRHLDSKYEYVVSFDKSGNTMVCTGQSMTTTGRMETTSWQMYRKE